MATSGTCSSTTTSSMSYCGMEPVCAPPLPPPPEEGAPSHEDVVEEAPSLHPFEAHCAAIPGWHEASVGRVDDGGVTLAVELEGLEGEGFGVGPATLEPLRDPAGVQDQGAPADRAAAQADVEEREAAARVAIDALRPDQRARHGGLLIATRKDPQARRSLQSLLLRGAFEGEQGDRLLRELYRAATEPVGEHIDRDALVSDLIQELDDPTAISQGRKSTCGVTSAAMYMAEHQPAEYVRIVRGLASVEGEVTLANGDTLARDYLWERELGHGDSGRALTQRLLNPALMEYANGAQDYDNARDTSTHLVLEDLGVGLDVDAFEPLMEALTAESFTSLTPEYVSRVTLAQALQRHTEAGHTVPVSVQWDDDSGHRVLVTGVDDDWVTFSNPWGEEDRMARAEFMYRTKDILLPE
ncbi:MAG: hypothetical protein KC933_16900 [Myxococcales bacterium]|nr:hypothetical protein [Myxococcales bacterium]